MADPAQPIDAHLGVVLAQPDRANRDVMGHATEYGSRVVNRPRFGVFDLTLHERDGEKRGVLMTIADDHAQWDVFLTLAQARRMVKGLSREIAAAEDE